MVFFEIFIDDSKEGLNKRMTGIHKSVMKLKGITDTRETRKIMQRNPDRLETQSENISVQ